MGSLLYLVLACGVIALVYAFFRARWIVSHEVENERLVEISGYIADGASAFLRREYLVMAPIVLLIAALLFIFNKGALKYQSLAFVAGAVMSALAGFAGMKIATKANYRTSQAANDHGLNSALQVAFSGGTVMGMSVVGLSLIGLATIFLLVNKRHEVNHEVLKNLALPLGTAFSLGASLVALFSRVGGGIYTKAADVAADLVGKLESGIPEDDPRNPAAIADNVGDNVGDVAGMGADLFESFVGSIVGAMILGLALANDFELQMKLMLLPLLIAALGVIASIVGTFFVKTKEDSDPQKALNTGTFVASGVAMLLIFFLLLFFIGSEEVAPGIGMYRIFGASFIGLVAGILIGQITEYYTGTDKKPVVSILQACDTGHATNIIAGISVGMRSTFPTLFLVALTIFLSHLAAGLYGVGIAAVGMLVTLGIQLAVDAYGPIADNAGGLAEMVNMDPEVREMTDRLDAVGNTTAAIGKGFAIGSAALTSIILFSSFKGYAALDVVELSDVNVLVGILVGIVIPFLFSALTMDAVGKAAFEMINEVRRQFNAEPGILQGTVQPDYARCIDISTKSSLRQMLFPSLIALLSPLIVGFLGGTTMLMGLLLGVTVSGVALSIFMANAGGAWDNAKKMSEAREDQAFNRDAYSAAVTGDMVGDPFKDTAGPSLNILIKLMSMVALVIAHML